MKTPLKTGLFLMALVTCLGLSGKATATVLPPNSQLPPDVFGALPGATQLATTGAQAFTSSTGAISGTFTASVFSDPGNTFGAGDLDFVYQVSNSAASRDGIARVTAIDFTSFLTDVGFTGTGSAIPGGAFVNGTTTPQLVDRSLSGGTVGFTFNAPLLNLIAPGSTSVALIIETNATAFHAGNANVIDGGVTTVNAFAPTTPAVPDSGATVALLGLALTGLEGVRRILRRR